MSFFQCKRQDHLFQYCLHSLQEADKPPFAPNGHNLTENKILQKMKLLQNLPGLEDKCKTHTGIYCQWLSLKGFSELFQHHSLFPRVSSTLFFLQVVFQFVEMHR